MKIYKWIICFTLFSFYAQGQLLDHSWENVVEGSSPEWYQSDQATQIAKNVLLYQRNIGGWPKNKSMHRPLTEKQAQKLTEEKSKALGATIDNGATTLEMYFLAKLNSFQPNKKYRNAFVKGLNYILEAQYVNGGWPQFYPLRNGYYSHITYNDDAMPNVMKLLYSIMKEEFPYNNLDLDLERKGKVAAAFQKGINCILNTQYKQDGQLTGWCAQHDVKTLLPAKARSYELPSLSGMESASLLELLMDIEKPTPRIVKSIEAGINWFKDAQLKGTRVERRYDANGKLTAKIVSQDKDAPPIWGRFMELDDNTPFFCDRDGIKKESLYDIGEERRLGYRWYTDRPQRIIDAYPKWKERVGAQRQHPKSDLYKIVVAQDGSGHFSTVQDALNSTKAFPYERVIIQIKKGIYREKVHVYAWNPKVSFFGEDKDSTIIIYDDYFDKINLGRNSTFHTATLQVDGDDFIAKNLTVKNSAGPVGQALALGVNANRAKFENCNFLGNQDTVYTSGEGFVQYFKNCHIEGTTDFIFGNATVLFENCDLLSKANSYITAASTPEHQSFGYVFKNCRLVADGKVNDAYLGRPWRTFAKTVFMNCEMDVHINPKGWGNWSNVDAETKGFYAEYNSQGTGANPDKRVLWSHQLTKSEIQEYSKENILLQKEDSKNPWYER
ncbi:MULTISPECIES: pectate lyase [Flavobacteriaceae]|uniref:pectate lyase n=1 Tax=Flavobacteriaceae TaxID=49546 RepID=UPI0014912D33|nr:MULTISPECIES: pectate lyase [Allomuricauda]MDC6365922.1 pectate lyase [Muricauda sp. AC10]